MTPKERQGLLNGLRVIDMSGIISGGLAIVTLGDFGADVVMIEHPDVPDPIREWPQENGEWNVPRLEITGSKQTLYHIRS